MDLSQLKAFLDEHQEPEFRYRQIIKNYYSGRVKSIDDMTDLSLTLRQQLSQKFSLLSVSATKNQVSGHTQKSLLKLSDGHHIESVLMDYDQWLTACVSSQVGCPLGCSFCATGQMGFTRNLTPEEIVDQVVYWNTQVFPKYIGRIVFMGMGEPFLNWDNLFSALKIINDKNGLNIGSRKISISTAGIVDKIIQFADLDSEINLAASLHSADQITRAKLMPIARQFPLTDLISACLYYVQKTHRQLFFEYALIDGVNDTPKHLDKVIDLVGQDRLFYLNLIPLNQIPGGLPPSSPQTIKLWTDRLTRAGLNFSLRRSFGSDISAACGQLATANTP